MPVIVLSSPMAKLPILEFPDPRLRTVARPVEKVDADLVRLIDDMGLDNANRLRGKIVRYIQEGHNVHVIQALLAA